MNSDTQDSNGHHLALTPIDIFDTLLQNPFAKQSNKNDAAPHTLIASVFICVHLWPIFLLLHAFTWPIPSLCSLCLCGSASLV